jgi:hypothetical protein
MSQRVYIDQILEPYVKQWLEEGQSFILEEDNDSGHHGSNAEDWKRRHSLQHWYNPANSPDLSPIENCWRHPDREVQLFSQFSEDTDDVFSNALRGWNSIRQLEINQYVLSMPQRCQDVIDAGGCMIGRERLTRLQEELQARGLMQPPQVEVPDSQEPDDDDDVDGEFEWEDGWEAQD